MKYLEEAIPSKNVRWTLGIIGILILALLIFHAGMVVGYHRALGSPFNRTNSEYGFYFPFFPGGFEMTHGFIQNTHGAVGTITEIALPTLTMQTRDGISQIILVSTSTIIRSSDSSAVESLSLGDQIVVLGEPDSQGRIDAKLIRISFVAK